MQETDARSFDDAQKIIPFDKQNNIDIIMRDYNATKEQAEHLFRQMWTFTYGMCSLAATKVCSFTEEETTVALGEIFRGMIFVIKSGNNPARLVPAENSSKEAEKIESHHPDLSGTKKQS